MLDIINFVLKIGHQEIRQRKIFQKMMQRKDVDDSVILDLNFFRSKSFIPILQDIDKYCERGYTITTLQEVIEQQFQNVCLALDDKVERIERQIKKDKVELFFFGSYHSVWQKVREVVFTKFDLIQSVKAPINKKFMKESGSLFEKFSEKIANQYKKMNRGRQGTWNRSQYKQNLKQILQKQQKYINITANQYKNYCQNTFRKLKKMDRAIQLLNVKIKQLDSLQCCTTDNNKHD